MSRELMSRYRTNIIEEFIKIEGFVSAIICKHYLGYVGKAFMLDILFDELCSSGLKANILRKTLVHYIEVKDARKCVDKFRQAARIRNYFAHCNTTVVESGLDCAPCGIPDPREPSDFLDIEKAISSFTEIITTMSVDLLEIMDKMGILFIQDTDKGVVEFIFEDHIQKLKSEIDGSATTNEEQK